MNEHIDIPANLTAVQQRIQAAAARAGRDAAGVTLVAVTKTHPVEMIQIAYQAGLRHFGENRVEEGHPKISALDEWLAAAGEAVERPTWHMIGHVQSRKAAAALADYDIIHSVDSLKLAERLNRLAEREGGELRVPVLLECNVSGEASKYGFELSQWRDQRDVRSGFFDVVRRIAGLPRLQLQGLMTMAPIVSDAEQARPVFASLRALRDALREEFPEVDWQHLSMGMTDDFEVAIEEGATIVRVGRAIFGPRACEL
ncbi:MAG: YggS family pyridoxal phosphate-dependent enzyme [Anaerolineae bacterium]